jgi:hypothetical protein
MRYVLIILALFVFRPAPGIAGIKLDDKTDIMLASVDEGVKTLTSRDDFVQRLSPFDRAARMKTTEYVSEEKYLEFVSKNVLQWNKDDKKLVSDVFSDIAPLFKEMVLPWPEKILIIKTSGKEEGGAAYTRSNAVVIPESMLKSDQRQNLRRTMCHELFHILSRKNPELRDKLYQAIGFYKCKEIEFPPQFASRKITNPDAPINDHCIKLKLGKDSIWAIPILVSKSEKYDLAQGGEFINYISLGFLVISKDNSTVLKNVTYDKNNPQIVGVNDVTGFYEQVGKNTQYIIHPEEILADNFAALVLGNKNVPSPEIIEKMKAVLKESYQSHNPKP